jgi:hypothetical protein
MPDVPRRDVLRSSELTILLRGWITLQQTAGITDQVIAGALIYELTALLAKAAQHPQSAHAAVEAFAKAMHEQIDTFGVNRQYP